MEKCAGLVTDLVTVTRTSFNTWTASADASSATTSATDLNALVKFTRGAWRAFGQYRMPFQLTIQCSNSSCQ